MRFDDEFLYVGARLEETLVGAVTQAVRVHGATAVDREVVRAAIISRTHECTSVRTVAAVLRDVAPALETIIGSLVGGAVRVVPGPRERDVSLSAQSPRITRDYEAKAAA
jgi:hypothetical protein